MRERVFDMDRGRSGLQSGLLIIRRVRFDMKWLSGAFRFCLLVRNVLRDKFDRRFYRPLMLRTDGPLFALLFNLRACLVYRSSARIRWSEGAFEVTDQDIPEFCYRIRHAQQCEMAYTRGVLIRSESIHKAYSLDLIDFQQGDVFLDCGANVGDLKIWFELHSIDVTYIGFEPSPQEYACLVSNVAPSVSHNVGLWNDPGDLTFYVSSQGADSSLIEPPDYDATIMVPTRRLDSYINGPIKCLKLEAEGAEPEILEGAGDALRRIEYIAADLGFERGVTAESTLAPVTNYLLARDFELVHVTKSRLCALYRNRAFEGA